ncbi:MAG: TIGR00730 family Rossman fold protein [Bacteroidales bacterium]|nr:TIGR00730 family Rossman fold protein [Bacteroidales bacterium]
MTNSEQQFIATINKEIEQGYKTLENIGKCVTVFGSSAIPDDSIYCEQAELTGKMLAEAGFAVITGGGPSIMEAVNRGAKNAGGHSIGLTMQFPDKCIENKNIDTMLRFSNMSVRKHMFFKYSSAFVALPGGFGTLDEAFECLALMQTGKISRRPFIFQDKNFWLPAITWIRQVLKNDYKVIGDYDLDLFSLTDEPQLTIETIINNSSN